MSVPTKFFLYKRNNGVYYVCYEINGRRCWKSTRTKRKSEAHKTLTNLRDLIRRKQVAPSLSRYTQEYIAHVTSQLSPGTVVGYRAALQSLLGFVGDLPLSAITERDVDGYIAFRLQRVKPVTVNIELRSLRAAMGVAVKWGMIEANPFTKVSLVRTPEVAPTFLSRQSLHALLETIKEGWLREIVVFAVSTGMRRGEILNLQWPEVDLQRRLIQVQSNGDFRTKHGRRRAIPINGVAYSLLSAKISLSTSSYVFTRNGRRIGYSFLTHLFKRYVRKAGLDERVHFHTLRHTFASWLAQDGVSLYAIQKLLGHSSSATTQIYSHLEPSELHGVVERIRVPLN